MRKTVGGGIQGAEGCRMSWLTQPLTALDLETTSLKTDEARIVTACLGHSDGVGL